MRANPEAKDSSGSGAHYMSEEGGWRAEPPSQVVHHASPEHTKLGHTAEVQLRISKRHRSIRLLTVLS